MMFESKFFKLVYSFIFEVSVDSVSVFFFFLDLPDIPSDLDDDIIFDVIFLKGRRTLNRVGWVKVYNSSFVDQCLPLVLL